MPFSGHMEHLLRLSSPELVVQGSVKVVIWAGAEVANHPLCA